MNRLQLWPQETELPAGNPAPEQVVLTENSQGEIPHAFFDPLHYEPNYAYPLLIWLHCPGGDERQLQRIMPEVSIRNYVAVGARGNRRISTHSRGFTWDIGDGDFAPLERAIFGCIDLARRRFHIAPHRIFLAGYQCGGTTAVRMALRHPGCFAGALSLGGPFPEGSMPLARLDQARRLPIFLAQGRDSREYPLEKTCDELRLFHAAGMCVTVRQYPCGDELNTQMLHDMNSWMMELVTGIPSQDASSQDSDHLN